jgi:hypothetical protein
VTVQLRSFSVFSRTLAWLTFLIRLLGLARILGTAPSARPEPARLRLLPPVSDGGGDAASLRAMCGGFHAAVMAQFDQGFEQFLRGRISLETYRMTIAAQHDAALQRIAYLLGAQVGGEIAPDVFARETADAEQALAAAAWCLRWADDQKAGPEDTPLEP